MGIYYSTKIVIVFIYIFNSILKNVLAMAVVIGDDDGGGGLTMVVDSVDKSDCCCLK